MICLSCCLVKCCSVLPRHNFLWRIFPEVTTLKNLMTYNTRKEKKNDWVLFGKMAILLLVFFKNIPFSTPIAFSSIQDLLIWEEMILMTREVAKPEEGLPLLGNSLFGNCFSLTFFYCFLFILCVGGCSCYRTHVEVNLWSYYSSSKTEPRLSGLLTRPFNC